MLIYKEIILYAIFSEIIFAVYNIIYCRCIRGVLVRAGNFGIEGPGFESGTRATTRGESCASSTCPMIDLRGQPAGSVHEWY